MKVLKSDSEKKPVLTAVPKVNGTKNTVRFPKKLEKANDILKQLSANSKLLLGLQTETEPIKARLIQEEHQQTEFAG
jgi:hypothetical protein